MLRVTGAFPGWFWRRNYDVTADASRFLVTTPVEGAAPPSSISVVMNWTAAVRKCAGAGRATTGNLTKW
jgi:hypothetical protein